jgi:hypothetical protein
MYFPSFYEADIDCGRCEKADCKCRGLSQRSNRDFEVTSGRCPKVPDRRGFVAKEEQENQRSAYPFVHVEIGDIDSVSLSISIPGDKRLKKVKRSRYGSWYYNTKDEGGNKIKRIIFMGACRTYKDLVEYGERVRADYFLLPCEITEWTA